MDHHDRKNFSRAIILAGGKGTRMRSRLQKVLHPFRGRPMIFSALDAAAASCDVTTVVVGHDADAVRAVLPPYVEIVVQAEQHGTGHAVLCAMTHTSHAGEDSIVVLPGDHPFISTATTRQLISVRRKLDASVVFATLRLTSFGGRSAQFEGCGRVLRDGKGEVAGIVEFRDASPEQKAVKEVNVSYYCFDGDWLLENIAMVGTENVTGELYLTDLVAHAVRKGDRVATIPLRDAREGMGVNSKEHLAALERS